MYKKEKFEMKNVARTTIIVSTIIIAVAALLLSNALGQRSFRSRGGRQGDSQLEKPTVPKDNNEGKILGVLENIRRSQSYRNVPPQDGRFLRIMAESMNAKNVVEIGTSNGYSALWLCLGLRPTGGKLITHEIDPYRASLARENFKRAGVEKMVTIVEGDAHEEVTKLKEPVDILFIDADKPGYLDYLNKLFPLVRPGGLILAHNMNYPAPDPKYIESITTNPDLETIFLLMQGPGMGVTLKKR